MEQEAKKEKIKDIVERIKQKKEFSKLPDSIVERVLNFRKIQKLKGKDKIKKTRAILRKAFSAFISQSLLKKSLKQNSKRDKEKILKKHSSTRERYPYFQEIYSRIFENFKTKNRKVNIIDLGAGINSFSYAYLLEQEKNINYIAIEAIGQLVDLTNKYFISNKFQGKAYCFDLFDSRDLKKIRKIIRSLKGIKIIFLLKMIGPIETIKRDYTKELLLNLKEDIDIFVLSFATKTLGKKTRFQVNRKWLLDFLRENFMILDDFEISGERFIIFRNN